MKNRIITSVVVVAFFFTLIAVANAKADVYVKVDANGVAIDGPIMCDAGTCGAGSTFSKLTLKEGERYVLQGSGSAGIGGNNPNTEVKVDVKTQVWTVTNTQTNTITQQFTPQTNPSNPQPVITTPIVVETITAIVDSQTVVADTQTVITKVETITANASLLYVLVVSKDKNGKIIYTKKYITVKVRKGKK